MKQTAISNTLPDNFPKTAADRERVIAAAPGEYREPTVEELAQMERSVVVYGGGPLAVREALAKRRRELAAKPPVKQAKHRLEHDILAEHAPV